MKTPIEVKKNPPIDNIKLEDFLFFIIDSFFFIFHFLPSKWVFIRKYFLSLEYSQNKTINNNLLTKIKTSNSTKNLTRHSLDNFLLYSKKKTKSPFFQKKRNFFQKKRNPFHPTKTLQFRLPFGITCTRIRHSNRKNFLPS